eukprot:9092646-Pyramimonas_sp.AAC.1
MSFYMFSQRRVYTHMLKNVFKGIMSGEGLAGSVKVRVKPTLKLTPGVTPMFRSARVERPAPSSARSYRLFDAHAYVCKAIVIVTSLNKQDNLVTE